MSTTGLSIWTIGHSTRTIEQFIALLQANDIRLLADVRRYAGSRRHPQFNPDALSLSLRAAGIDYAVFPELGGRRNPRPDSVNTAWRNASFRGYADYMETPAFRDALERFLALARRNRSALMCAEALWWQCHRALIADVLKAGGACVLHIMERGEAVEHPFTSAAQIENGRLSYGGPQGSLPW